MRLMGRDFALSSHWMKILKVSFSLIIPHTELRLPDGLDETNCFMIKTNKQTQHQPEQMDVQRELFR